MVYIILSLLDGDASIFFAHDGDLTTHKG